MLEQRYSCASHICISVEKLRVLSALRKEGKIVDSNGCSMLSKSLDLNKVSIFRVSTLTGEVSISELKL